MIIQRNISILVCHHPNLINSESATAREANIAPVETPLVPYSDKLGTLSTALQQSSEPFNLAIRRRKVYCDAMQKLKRHFKTGVK